jgi:hypothetical protein
MEVVMAVEVQSGVYPGEGQDVSDRATDTLAIAGVTEPNILRYFESFNSGEFQATADLFAGDGTLYPPFESPITGREAIAAYLQAEAKGMKLSPQEGISETLETGETEFRVTGKVQTPLFGVNVTWRFVVDSESEIVAARIKLLAALEELLTLKQ